MPELNFIKKNSWFISIWDINEPVSFLSSGISTAIYNRHKEKVDHEHRLIEKILPHYILNKANINCELNNFERRPTIDNGYISISHSKSILALYYHELSPIGIDIEHKGARIMRITHKFLNSEERNKFEKSPLKCLIAWSVKEAIFKKYGGQAAFFSENIRVCDFELPENNLQINAFVKLNGTVIKENLNCEIFDDFVMVYTI